MLKKLPMMLTGLTLSLILFHFSHFFATLTYAVRCIGDMFGLSALVLALIVPAFLFASAIFFVYLAAPNSHRNSEHTLNSPPSRLYIRWALRLGGLWTCILLATLISNQIHRKSIVQYFIANGIEADIPDVFSDWTIHLTEHTPLELSLKQIALLSRIESLWSLTISDNSISTLPERFFDIVGLRILYITSESMQHLPDKIGRSNRLKHLYLSLPKLRILPDGITQLERLDSLDLISMASLVSMPVDMTGLKALKSLRLSGTTLKEIPESICGISSLTSLSIDVAQGHYQKRDYVTRLPQSLDALKNLTELRIYKTSLKELPQSIYRLTQLKRLTLVDLALVELPVGMGQLKNLTDLDLKINRLKELPPDLTAIAALERLSIHSWELQKWPEDLGRLTGLKRLILSGGVYTVLPASIGDLQNLERLMIDYSGNCRRLPDTVGNLSNLRYLSLHLTGIQALPESISKLANLNQLIIIDSPIEGTGSQ